MIMAMDTIMRYRFRLAILLLLSLLISCSKDASEEKYLQDVREQDREQDLCEWLSVPQRATEVSLDQALVATRMSGQSSLRSGDTRSVRSSMTLYTSTGAPALYVINYIPEGYVVVSASRKYTPIIAHSFKGEISLESGVNPAVQVLLEEYVRNIEYANTLPDSLVRSARLQWEMLGEHEPIQQLRSVPYQEEMYRKISEAASEYANEGYRVYRYRDILGDYNNADGNPGFGGSASWGSQGRPDDHYIFTSEVRRQIDESIKTYANKSYSIEDHVLILLKKHSLSENVSPLLSTTWGQGFYPQSADALRYYLMRDQYNMFIPNYYLVGCVPVAVAQIMRYHRSHSTEYDWDAMYNTRPSKTTAKFLYDVAKGVKTIFGSSSSKSTIGDVQRYLTENKYSVRRIDDNGYDTGGRLRKELDNARPMYVQGEDSDSGHAFVLDGYSLILAHYDVKVIALPDAPIQYLRDEKLSCILEKEVYTANDVKYHLNLGWEGYGDGFYRLENFRDFNRSRKYLLITPPKQ